MCSYCSVVHPVLSSEDVGLSEGTLRLKPTELASHGTGPGIQRLVFFPRFLLDVRGSVDHMATAASCHARGRDMCQAQCCPFSLVTETCPPTSPPPLPGAPPRSPSPEHLPETSLRIPSRLTASSVPWEVWGQFFFFSVLHYLFTYLAMLGLSCGTWDPSLWHSGSLLVLLSSAVLRLSCPAACGIFIS